MQRSVFRGYHGLPYEPSRTVVGAQAPVVPVPPVVVERRGSLAPFEPVSFKNREPQLVDLMTAPAQVREALRIQPYHPHGDRLMPEMGLLPVTRETLPSRAASPRDSAGIGGITTGPHLP